MRKTRKRFGRRNSTTTFEKLEPRRYLASVGWDGAGQGAADLTYYLGEAPGQIGQSTFEATIEQALEVWSEVADITFTKTDLPRQSDSLDITFESLDGPGGVLARAYFPDDVNRSTIAGDIQFDVSENWEVGNGQGSNAFDLLYVAVHEIGHALGLEHSDTPGSVLNDSVSPNQMFTSLSVADQNAALNLYAPAKLVDTDPTSPLDPTSTDNDGGIPSLPDDPTPEPPADPDLNDPDTTDFRKRFRWFHFRRGGFKRFQFFNFFDRPFDTQANHDSFDSGESGRFNQRFRLTIFRFFRF